MTTAWILTAGLGLVLVLPLAFRVARRRFDPFEPVVLFVLAWGAMFVVRPAAVIAREDFEYWGVDIRETMPLALLLALTGAVAFLTAYELTAARRWAGRRRELPLPRLRTMTIGALAAAAVAAVALLVVLPLSEGPGAFGHLLRGRSERLGELTGQQSTYVWSLSLLFVPAAFLAFAVALRRRTTASWALFAALLVPAVVRTVPVGNRGVLLPFAGGMLMLVYLHLRRRPGTAALAGVVVAALLASYLVLLVRYPYTRGDTLGGVRAVATDPAAVFEPVLSGADAEMVEALAAGLTAVPDRLGWQYGRAVVGDLVRRPIPREAWPGKPLTPAREVRVELWPEPVLRHGFDPAFSTLLVFFRDLGVYGVLAGMALFGLLSRALYTALLRRPGAPAVQALYAVLVWYLVVGLRDGPVDMLVQAAFVAGPVALVLAAATWWPARRPAAAPALARERLPEEALR